MNEEGYRNVPLFFPDHEAAWRVMLEKCSEIG